MLIKILYIIILHCEYTFCLELYIDKPDTHNDYAKLINQIHKKALAYRNTFITLDYAKKLIDNKIEHDPPIIYFNNHKHNKHLNQENKYFYLSNHFECPIIADNKEWKTNEHYYQAMHFSNPPDTGNPIIDSIRSAKTVQEVLTLAAKHKKDIVADFYKRDLDTMIKVVWLKFNQDLALQKDLLNTGDSILAAQLGRKDHFYGIGHKYTGANWLGYILMAVRDTIREQQKTNQPVSNSKSPAPKTLQSTPSKSTKIAQSTTKPKPSLLPQQKSFFQWLFEWLTSWFY